MRLASRFTIELAKQNDDCNGQSAKIKETRQAITTNRFSPSQALTSVVPVRVLEMDLSIFRKIG
jgi:hypothetical protein